MRLKFLLILLQVPPLILLMAVMAGVSLYTLNNSVDDWTAQIQDHVLAEERAHIVSLAENVALFTSRRFGRMTADMLVVRDYAQQLVNQSLVVTAPYKSYHMDPRIDTSTEPTSSRMASQWFNLRSTNATEQRFLGNSSAMNNVWRTLPSLYQNSGFGLESDGFYCAFPLSRSTTRSTMKSICHINNTEVTGYDPRCRAWYTGAKALTAGTTVDVFYTAPYVDARTSDVIISSSAPVWSPAPDSTILFGVVVNDININDLEKFYRSNKVLDKGFPFVLDDTTAQLLYYPGMSRASPQFFRGLHFGSETSSESTAFSKSFNSSASQAKNSFTTESFSYSRGGVLWQASISSVNGTSYIVGVVVPESDIRKPVDEVVLRAQTALAVALTVIIIVIVIMLVASIILNFAFASSVTSVIYDCVDVTKKFADGDFGTAEGNEKKEKSDIYEIYNIQDSFKKLALAVQFSNPEYFQNDTPGALRVSLDVEKMLDASGNNRGLGTVQNNIALYVRSLDGDQGKFTDSLVLPYLEKSIISGVKALNDLSGKDDDAAPEPTAMVDMHSGERRSMQISLNNRRLNVLAVSGSCDASHYYGLIEAARKCNDPAGVVAGYLRLAESLELKDRFEDARVQRKAAVKDAVEILTHVVRNAATSEKVEIIKPACDAVFEAALQMATLRQEETLNSKVSVMYQHLNLALLASALLEASGSGCHHNTKRAQLLLSYVLLAREENDASNALVEMQHLTVNPEIDLEPVKPGLSVAVENLLSGEAQEMDGFYNAAAVAGDFGENAQYDEYGNPIGSDNELAQDGAFKGVKLLVGNYVSYMQDCVRDLVVPELEKKGFEVKVTNNEKEFNNLLDPEVYAVAWIVSDGEREAFGAAEKKELARKVRIFHEAGRGLMIWGDNDPYFADANVALKELFDMRLIGDTPGGKNLVPGDPKVKGHFSRDHLICTGILTIAEGYTICYPEYHTSKGTWTRDEPEDWTCLGTSTDDRTVLVAREALDLMHGPGRVIIDNGWTKMMSRYWTKAGNSRYVSNCTAWLCLMERPENRAGGKGGNGKPPPPGWGALQDRAKTQVKGVVPDPKPKLTTLGKKMVTRFGTAYFLFILSVFIVCLVVSLTTTDRTADDLRVALKEQIQRQATSLMEGAASVFAEDLATASESGTAMIAQATADVFRTSPPYCLAPRTSYYDLGGTTSADLKPPLEMHHGYLTSLQASSFYLPLQFGNASNLTASVNTTADTTSNLDPFFASIYGQKKDDYFMLGAGFEENSAFRRMPATDTNALDPARTYNPTKRPWYTDAKLSASSIYTPPYRGATTKRWMISVASASRLDNSTFVGSAITDILLQSLVESIRNSRVLDSGKVTLVDHTSGSTSSATVVADQEWAMSDSVATIYTLDTLTKPEVNENMQSFITDTPLHHESSNTRSATFGTTYAGESGMQDVLVIPTRLAGYGDRYYFTAFVKASEVYAAFEPLLAEVKDVNTMLSVILVIVWAVTCVIAFLTVVYASSLVVKPIITVEGNVQRMVENVGSPDITKGCEEIDSAPYESATQLATNFNAMVKTMRESAHTSTQQDVRDVESTAESEATYAQWMRFVPPLRGEEVIPQDATALESLWDGTILRREISTIATTTAAVEQVVSPMAAAGGFLPGTVPPPLLRDSGAERQQTSLRAVDPRFASDDSDL